MGKHTTILTSS